MDGRTDAVHTQVHAYANCNAHQFFCRSCVQQKKTFQATSPEPFAPGLRGNLLGEFRCRFRPGRACKEQQRRRYLGPP
eukprot:7263155-Prorocentrum_lima.AAC.1